VGWHSRKPEHIKFSALFWSLLLAGVVIALWLLIVWLEHRDDARKRRRRFTQELAELSEQIRERRSVWPMLRRGWRP